LEVIRRRLFKSIACHGLLIPQSRGMYSAHILSLPLPVVKTPGNPER
jgi:hypothetical protein